MWLYLPDAFLSLVADHDTAMLLVRAHVRGDIERVFHGVAAEETPADEYRFHAVIDRQIVADVIAGRLLSIDYDSHRAAVTDDERHAVYLDVWLDTREGFGSTEPQRAARANGAIGGRIGGPARAAKLSPERRSEIARIGAAARWAR